MGIVKEVAGWIFEIVVTILIAFTCVYFAPDERGRAVDGGNAKQRR